MDDFAQAAGRLPDMVIPFARDIAVASNLGIGARPDCPGPAAWARPAAAARRRPGALRTDGRCLRGCSADRGMQAGNPLNSVSAADVIRDEVLQRIEPSAAIRLTEAQLLRKIEQFVAQIANERRLLLNVGEQHGLATEIVNDMIGLGPLEPLLRDDTVADILVNGPNKIYVERQGKLELTPLQFRHDAHVLHVAQRIASSIGRRVDEFEPDARRAAARRQPRQRHHPAAEPEGALHLDPQVLQGRRGFLAGSSSSAPSRRRSAARSRSPRAAA